MRPYFYILFLLLRSVISVYISIIIESVIPTTSPLLKNDVNADGRFENAALGINIIPIAVNIGIPKEKNIFCLSSIFSSSFSATPTILLKTDV